MCNCSTFKKEADISTERLAHNGRVETSGGKKKKLYVHILCHMTKDIQRRYVVLAALHNEVRPSKQTTG